MEPVKKEHFESAAVKQKYAMLTTQIVLAAHAWNVTPEQAGTQIVADLYEHLSRGGSVTVHVTGMSGEEYTLEVRARR